MAFDVEKIRSNFPILSQKVNGKDLVYFDNAATTQKPQAMIDELVRFYSTDNSNIHRGVHTLSQRATAEFEATRDLVAETYGCKSREVVFTKNDTEALNIIAHGLSGLLDSDSNIVLTESEHHSNIVPWQISNVQSSMFNYQSVKVEDSKIRFVEIDSEGFIDLEDLKTKIDVNTKVFSFAWASNTYGVVNDIKEVVKIVRSINPEIIIVVDAAQITGHQTFQFRELGIDFITFSAHKMYGPTGVGVLIGKAELLEQLKPLMGGGDMIKSVDFYETTFNDIPYRFEAGTPNIADVIAFKKTLNYLDSVGFEDIKMQEEELAVYLLKRLGELEFIEIYGVSSETLNLKNKLPLVSFNLKSIHAHDVGTLLDEDGIAVRSGHHCSQLVMKKLGIPASVRVSLAFYNTKEEIDKLVESLKKVRDVFK